MVVMWPVSCKGKSIQELLGRDWYYYFPLFLPTICTLRPRSAGDILEPKVGSMRMKSNKIRSVKQEESPYNPVDQHHQPWTVYFLMCYVWDKWTSSFKPLVARVADICSRVCIPDWDPSLSPFLFYCMC